MDNTYYERILRIPNGDNEVYGRMYLPDGDGNFPAVIIGHGYNGSHSDWDGECRYFAAHGYVAFAYDFCGGSTRSRSTGDSVDMTIPGERSDVIAVFEAISSMETVDSDRVFLMGGSQGGFATALAAEELTAVGRDFAGKAPSEEDGKAKEVPSEEDRQAAAAQRAKAPASPAGMILYFPAFCAPDDWRKSYPEGSKVPEVIDFWGLKLGRTFVDTIREIEVYQIIGGFQKPVILFHGTEDDVVSIHYSERAVMMYDSAELVTLKGEGHGFSPEGSASAMEQVLVFMNRV